MEEKENKTEDSIEYILKSLLEILSQDKHTDVDNINFVHESSEIYASPEEGARLIRAFIRIKQLESRAAIIELATQMARR